MATTILLVDDHAVLRQALRQFLGGYADLSVVAEASCGSEAIQLAGSLHPDVAVVNIKMPGMNGIEATTEILRASPGTAVVILSIYGDERYVRGALRAGAVAYLLKDSVEEELVPAIACARERRTYFSPAIAGLLKQQSPAP